MELPAPNSVEDVCARFRIDWNKGNRPQIAEHLDGTHEPVRSQLLAALISVELELGIASGKHPRPEDYAQLGSNAVAIAKELLEESDRSISQLLDAPTAFFSVDALGDKSETFSLEEVTSDEDTLFKDSGGALKTGGQSKFIGRYKLLQQIGVGGMGAVWMAEQLEPVKRRVALKVIRGDLGGKSAIARFEAERQACALMDHQNIAKILDGGTTETGNPYFVMELVNGIPLNKYCDKNRLDVRARLQLMIPVCRAVQHAHQKGIIHRDLKHSNVLVTEYDGQPVPKVIDFGLAKALGHQDTLTDKTMFTEIGKVVGTLQYMSPEQAETGNMDVDTRSDVYSLGVMVYKLLVGATPLDDGTLVHKSLLDALKIIREKDPTRPSLRLSVDPNLTKRLCELRQVQPDKLKQILEGDLDWIVMKALEKDRRDRYETANGLAMELERYLNDEQVLARPHSAVYSVKKFVKRHRGLVASILGFSFLLIAGIVATSSAMVLFYNERETANEERNRANEKSALAEAQTIRATAAQKKAEDSETLRKIELLSTRLTSAWSDWLLGETESAWLTLNKLSAAEYGWESWYVRSEFSSSKHVYYGHSRDVVTLDVSNDGRYIVTGAHDDSIKVWNARTKKLLYTRCVTDQPTCVRFSEDSKLVACADRSNRVTVWHTASGEPHEKTLGPFPTDVTCIEFFPDGGSLIIGAAERDSYREGYERMIKEEDASPPSIRIVSLNDETDYPDLVGHTKDITSICYCSFGAILASGSLDNTIRIWTRIGDRFELTQTLDKHVAGVTCVSISPSGKQLLSGNRDNTIQLWDLESGELLRTFVGHSDDVNSARFSTDGQRIVSASADRTARVWSIGGDQLLVCKGHFNSLNDAIFSFDGREILTASADQTVRVWNSNNKPSTVVVHAHKDTVWAADFSPDGKTVASASEDGAIAFIDAETGDIKHVIGKNDDPLVVPPAVLSLDYSPMSEILATGGVDQCVHVWNALNYTSVKTFKAHDNYIWGVSFSPDGRYLVTSSADSTAKIWNTGDWSLAGELVGHKSEVASARFSPGDGKLIVTASDDHTVKLWDANSYALIKTFEGHTNAVWKAIFSPSGKLIASSGFDGEVIIWDVETKVLLSRIQAHTNQIAGLAFSTDGSRLVTACDDKTIKIFDMKSKIDLFLLRDEGNSQITHVAFSNDGKKLVSGNKGWVTIRAATCTNADTQPFFVPQNAEAIWINGLQILIPRNVSTEDLKRELMLAEKCCNHYPSYRTYTNLGIAQYRLGQVRSSVENLTEADRLEPIQYGQSDQPPVIEAFLSMALLKAGDAANAIQIRDEFNEKRIAYWLTDEKVSALAIEVDEVFATFK